MEAGPGFTLEVSQNEYLSVDDDEMQAVLTVTGHGAGRDAGPGPVGQRRAEVILVDCSSSMDGTKISAARQATAAAIDTLKDGTLFAVVEGTDQARMVYPAEERMATASRATREGAKKAVRKLDARGATSIHAWLALARRLFAGTTAEIRHAILLTDGQNYPPAEEDLHQEVDRCVGVFSCDPRGIGEDWDPRDLRMIAARLDGKADAAGGPAELEADFRAMAEAAMGKAVPSVRLRIRMLPGLRIRFLRRVYPALAEPPWEKASEDGRTVEYDLGAWGDEVREYLICLAVGPDAPERVRGESIRLARVDLLTSDPAEGPAGPRGAILVRWTTDPVELTQLDPKVEHYTGQTELSELVNGGYDAYQREAYEEAALHWGKALEKAAAAGREELRERLKRLVRLDEAGVPRLRPDLQELDSKMASVISDHFSRSSGEGA